MFQDHGRDSDRSAYDQGRDRHQQAAQTGEEFEKVVHRATDYNRSRPLRDTRCFAGEGARATQDSAHRILHTANLVELTGIEPVASWLQTRRSPS